MEVYKFGGASVKDADGVRNFVSVLKRLGRTRVVVVVSAMGKMTNAFEDIVRSFFKDSSLPEEQLDLAWQFHKNILRDLDIAENQEVHALVDGIFDEIREFLGNCDSMDFDYVYDQVVSRAELLSTRICSAYLKIEGEAHNWLDVRECIRTNSDFRRARVDWEATCSRINELVDSTCMTITQGFLGSDADGNTTTLGREGSDYTAGIFAYCLNAEQVSVFKDVPGVLNADPRVFAQTSLLDQISYKEAIEMAFFGASVIHPKTLQPLQRKKIPLRVRSFLNPEAGGTRIEEGLPVVPLLPCYIVKKEQILVSVSDKEFHFVMESDISEIFGFLHRHKMKVNLIQNSAISFSVCIEDNFNNFIKLLEALQPRFKVLYNENVTLYTIRHFNKEAIDVVEKDQTVLLKQMSRETVQIIVK